MVKHRYESIESKKKQDAQKQQMIRDSRTKLFMESIERFNQMRNKNLSSLNLTSSYQNLNDSNPYSMQGDTVEDTKNILGLY